MPLRFLQAQTFFLQGKCLTSMVQMKKLGHGMMNTLLSVTECWKQVWELGSELRST